MGKWPGPGFCLALAQLTSGYFPALFPNTFFRHRRPTVRRATLAVLCLLLLQGSLVPTPSNSAPLGPANAAFSLTVPSAASQLTTNFKHFSNTWYLFPKYLNRVYRKSQAQPSFLVASFLTGHKEISMNPTSPGSGSNFDLFPTPLIISLL